MSESENLMNCPNCGESIQAVAILCRFCGTGLSPKHFRPCPLCAEMIRTEATLCRFCKTDLGASQTSKLLSITGPLTVKELAHMLHVLETEVIKRLFMKGVMRTVNQLVEPELAKDLALEMSYELAAQEDIDVTEAGASEGVESGAQVKRPPVVTIINHPQDGTSGLLDVTRRIKFLVSEDEPGDIHHIAAFHVDVPAEDGSVCQIVFLDTQRRATSDIPVVELSVADIAVLVVNDGISLHTRDAVNYAKAAGVPIIVAIDQVDKDDAGTDQLLKELTKYGLVPDKFGGDTVTVNISSKTGSGLDELFEMILLVSDIADLKANPIEPATGTIIKAELSRGKGTVATVLISNGTLQERDYIVAGSVGGQVRALFNDHGKRVKAAGPSMPVEVLGFTGLPQVWDRFEVVTDAQSSYTFGKPL